jgi:uncharacterized protein (TIGR03435 family)
MRNLIAAALTLGVLSPVPIAAQTTPLPTFEVASVKPNKAREGRMMISMPPGRFSATNVPLRLLIRQAYELEDFQIVGGPDWINSDRFDVEAKAEGDVGRTPPGSVGPMHLMLQSLLAERFRLKVRVETRELPIYTLVLSRADRKPGPQLRIAGEECTSVIVPGGMPAPPQPPGGPTGAAGRICPSLLGPFFISGRRMTMTQLSTGLSTRVSRLVADRTGLNGEFDLDLTFTPDGAPADQPLRLNGVDLALNAPSIFTALQEQLGLKLESQRGPVEVIVIDNVEPPTPD